jgi:hypothetical protein
VIWSSDFFGKRISAEITWNFCIGPDHNHLNRMGAAAAPR